MQQFTWSLNARWILLLSIVFLTVLDGYGETSSTSGNFYSKSIEMVKADEDKKKAWDLRKQGDYDRAAELDEKVLVIYKKQLGSRHKKVGYCLNDLGVIYKNQGRYSEAEEVLKKALEIIEKELGTDHPKTAKSWMELGNVYSKQGRYSEAERVLKKALEINETKLEIDHPRIAKNLMELGNVYYKQSRYSEAEKVLKKALKINEKRVGINHPRVAKCWIELGNVYRSQGKYSKAEKAMKKALGINEKRLGIDHPGTAKSWIELGNIYRNQGRLSEAEEALIKALEINGKKLGIDHPGISKIWIGLGNVYRHQGRYSDAEKTLKKALAINEKELGADHPGTAKSWIELGNIYRKQGRYSEAEKALKKALEINEEKLGVDHPGTARCWVELGSIYSKQRRLLEAEKALKKALDINENKFGTDHPRTTRNRMDLGNVYRKQGRLSAAEKALKKALDINEKILGADHPRTAKTKTYLAKSLLAEPTQSNIKSALNYIRQAGSSLAERFSELSANKANGSSSEEKTYRWIHTTHLEILSQARSKSLIDIKNVISESFIVSQRCQNSTVAKAISKMTARLSLGQGELKELVSKQQTILDQLVSADNLMINAFSQGYMEVAESTRSTITHLKTELTEINTKLAAKYPEYAELSDPRPIPLHEVQALLNTDEALIAIITDKKQSYLWGVRSDKAEWWTLPANKEQIDDTVETLRAALDFTVISAPDNFLSFPVNKSQKLYEEIIAPAARMLKGSKQIFVVADGSLQSIPFGILVNGDNKKSSYKDANWLTKEYAFAYLPSISSLKALRSLGNKNVASDPFLGFGDPVLGNREGELRVASVYDKRGTGLADIRGIRKLASLPETADELNSLATILGASNQSVYLQEMATETKLKNMNLANSRVLAFATHGLMAGDFEFLGEPALVLTPPDKATEKDDGLLTASEVAQIKLNADWIVLSACNTASSDGTPGAEGFSGLTKAFFYAGAKTLLVSHWPVESNSAKQLTTRMFRTLQQNPGIGKAGALRQARLQLINDQQHPYYAHPLFWAPFVVVGETNTTR